MSEKEAYMSILIFTADGTEFIESCINYAQVGTVLDFHPRLTETLPYLCAGKATQIGNYLLIKDICEGEYEDDDDCCIDSDLDRILSEGVVDEPVFSQREMDILTEEDIEELESESERENDLEKIALKAKYLNSKRDLPDYAVEQILDKWNDTGKIQFSTYHLTNDDLLAFDKQYSSIDEYVNDYINTTYPTEDDLIEAFESYYDGDEPSEGDLEGFTRELVSDTNEYISYRFHEALSSNLKYVQVFDQIVCFYMR